MNSQNVQSDLIGSNLFTLLLNLNKLHCTSSNLNGHDKFMSSLDLTRNNLLESAFGHNGTHWSCGTSIHGSPGRRSSCTSMVNGALFIITYIGMNIICFVSELCVNVLWTAICVEFKLCVDSNMADCKMVSLPRRSCHLIYIRQHPSIQPHPMQNDHSNRRIRLVRMHVFCRKILFRGTKTKSDLPDRVDGRERWHFRR